MQANEATVVPIVHVVDDDAGIRDAIADLFLSVEREARCYANGLDFLEQADPDAPGCLLTDVRLPKLGGLELQDRLSSHGFSLPVVFMSGFADVPMSVRGLKSGAVDFLLKPLRDQDVLDATDAAIELDRDRRGDAMESARIRTRLASLTTREREVLALVLDGRKNREVAEILSLSEITVKIHRGTAMRKIEARNVQQLVRMDRLLSFTISGWSAHLLEHEG